MDGNFTVKAVDSENKSPQEIEQELIDNANVEGEEAEKEAEVVVPENTEKEVDTEEKEIIKESPVELSDDDVLSYINNKRGKEFSDIDSMFNQETIKEETDEAILAFSKYRKETGGSMNDFYQLNRDFTKENDNSLLRSFYKETIPGLEDSDIDFELDDKFGYDMDVDEEKEIKSKQIAKKREVAKARDFFEKRKEQYKGPFESRDPIVPEGEKESYHTWLESQKQASKQQDTIAKQRSHFSDKTDQLFSDNFEGFEFNIDEDKKVTYKVSDTKKIKDIQSDARNFINKHIDDDGMLKDASAYHKALFTAENPDSIAKFFYELGASEAIKKNVETSKNINMKPNSANLSVAKEGFKVASLDKSHGNSLKIKTRKTN